MVRLCGGVVLLVAGAAALAELRAHESYLYPLIRHHRVVRLEVGGWTGPLHSLAWLAAWALVCAGALLFVIGMGAWARRRRAAAAAG